MQVNFSVICSLVSSILRLSCRSSALEKEHCADWSLLKTLLSNNVDKDKHMEALEGPSLQATVFESVFYYLHMEVVEDGLKCHVLWRIGTQALEGNFSYYLQLICYSLIVITYLLMLTWFHIDMQKCTEALEGHFSYYLQLICYSLIVITYLLMLTWFHIDMPNSDCYVPDFM